MLPSDDLYLFGRVIRTDALGPMSSLLIYIYDYRAETKEPPSQLSRDRLLIDPTFTNRLGWNHGRFEMVESRPLAPQVRFDTHCFHTLGRYQNEDWNRLPGPVDPCFEGGGLRSYRRIDDLICEALDLPKAPV